MKTTIGLTAALMITAVIFLQGSRVNRNGIRISFQDAEFEYPAAVKAVIDQKCYVCHNLDGKSADAKKGLLWDSIPKYNKARQVGKLDDIIGVLEDGSMPPKEMIEKGTAARLTKNENQVLKNWAEETADNLMR